MNLIKLLWCKITGHEPVTDEVPCNYRESDGSVEYYDVCKKCGCEINHTTFYDCADFTPDDLINTKLNQNK
jgi:hypothetical protein